jgi:hypothetical protein
VKVISGVGFLITHLHISHDFSTTDGRVKVSKGWYGSVSPPVSERESFRKLVAHVFFVHVCVIAMFHGTREEDDVY